MQDLSSNSRELQGKSVKKKQIFVVSRSFTQKGPILHDPGIGRLKRRAAVTHHFPALDADETSIFSAALISLLKNRALGWCSLGYLSLQPDIALFGEIRRQTPSGIAYHSSGFEIDRLLMPLRVSSSYQISRDTVDGVGNDGLGAGFFPHVRPMWIREPSAHPGCCKARGIGRKTRMNGECHLVLNCRVEYRRPHRL